MSFAILWFVRHALLLFAAVCAAMAVYSFLYVD